MNELADLLGRVSLRDRGAFDSLYSATSPKLFGIVLRIVRDRSEAEEALQDVYVKVWQRAERYRPEQGAPMTWLGAVARYHAIDLVRARKPQTSELDDAFAVASGDPSPEDMTIIADEGVRIEICMQRLAEDRASAVKKAYIEGLSYQELAELYSVPLNTMRTWLRRSLQKLRECLDQ